MITMLHIIETLDWRGGTPRKLLALAKSVDRQNAKIVFLHFRPSPMANMFASLGWEVRGVNSDSLLALISEIHSAVRDHGIDVICTHFTRALTAGFVVGKLKGIPVVHNEHSSASYRSGIRRILASLIMPSVNLVICNSHHTRLSVVQGYPCTAGKLAMIRNPVEERISSRSRKEVRESLDVGDDETVILHIGGMIAERDQQTLIEAVGDLRKTHPKVQLVMIGDGPCRPQLEASVKTTSLGQAVRFLGYTDEIGEYLQAADIYVNPTLDEGFGIAVVEAMLSGKPVVLSNCGAHPELIVPDESGFLYEGGNAEALSSRLRFLVDNPDVCRLVGESGRKHALRHFSPSEFAAQYLELVHKVIVASRVV